MAIPGKRKSRSSLEKDERDDADQAKKQSSNSTGVRCDEYAALLRSHFESEFEPLSEEAGKDISRERQIPERGGNVACRSGEEKEAEEEGSENAEWGGLPDDDDDEYGYEEQQQGLESNTAALAATSTDYHKHRGNCDMRSDDGEDQEEQEIQIIDHSASISRASSIMSRKEQARFLSSKPAAFSSSSPPSPPSPDAADGTVETASSLLKKDLALSRLLSESHILLSSLENTTLASGLSSSAANNSYQPRPFSRVSRRAQATSLSLRLQALGANRPTAGHQAQKKMPMAMRKAILEKEHAREEKRRREARENGVVLETSRKKGSAGKAAKKNARGKRDVGAGMTPGIGRMRGAELRLSKRDIREMEDHGGRRAWPTGKSRWR